MPVWMCRVVVLVFVALGVVWRAAPATRAQQAAPAAPDPIATLVARLDLERYKATIKGLTQFGDRREGTDRNRAAVDWIEAQLKSYGCTNTERVTYTMPPPAAPQPPAATSATGGTAAGAASAPGAQRPPATPKAGTPMPLPRAAVGGGRPRGNHNSTLPNSDLNAQPDPKLRALNAQEPTSAPRQQVYCTKVGTTRPDEMYIIGAHMDGRGFGEAANDNGSGTAIVMELARIFSAPDVRTERSIRFALWNSEEGGLNGARAYVEQRKGLQGREDPAGSGRFPEPRWLGMIQHDMMLFDHGMPRPDGSVSKEQRPEADVNVEFQMTAKFSLQAQALAWAWHAANEKYATDYPATVGPHMTNTDSTPFMDEVAAISVRENERGVHVGSGWDPQWHQPTDLFVTYTDKDFRLGLNAAQTTLGGVATLAGAGIGR